ncbi:MAG: phosphatase PAP2 family protein [Saprospiraceae bacterium]|nr:phosphatase PAP2 family protein [Saprospiraceae bacterium]
MPKYACSLLLSFLIAGLVIGQSPYETNGNTERSIMLPGGIALGSSLLIGSKNKPLSADQLEKLNPRNIWGVDRWVTKQFSKKAAKTSDVLLYSSYAVPLTTLLGAKTRKDFGQVGLFALEGLLLNTAATNLTKVLAKRIRPFVYNPSAPLPPKLAKNALYSFFSGHTSNVATMYFLTATVLQDFYPNKGFNNIIWPTAVIIPAVTGYLRMRAGKHFLTDVLTGYVVGAFFGILVPQLHRL